MKSAIAAGAAIIPLKKATAPSIILLITDSIESNIRANVSLNVNAPKDSPIHSTSITPIHIIRQIMLKFD